MATSLSCDICVIGAGSAGLSVAAGTSQMGARTVLIEQGVMGGDCLNTGCVPSKSMIASSRVAQTIRSASRFGVDGGDPRVDFRRVQDHVHGVIDTIAPIDSVERFEGLGVTVLRERARFTGPRTLRAGPTEVTARRFVVATGSSALVPPVPGLDTVPYLTNETVFENRDRPDHLIVLGGGPIGLELAQAHRRLGSRVTVIEKARILPKDDPELVDIVRRSLVGDGIDLREGAELVRVEKAADGLVAVYSDASGEKRIDGTALLVAVGRSANVDDLGLEEAGIAYSAKGIETDARLRTTNHKIFAIGDVTGRLRFTHMAGYHAGIVIRNALFRLPAKVQTDAFPWATFTAPELAQVGQTDAQAQRLRTDVRVLRWCFDENDRAQTERETEGMVKAVVAKNGRILGAGIVGPHAGELIHLWTLAIGQKLKIGAIANMIAPYPTLGEASKRAAGSFYTPRLFSDRTRRIVRLLARLG